MYTASSQDTFISLVVIILNIVYSEAQSCASITQCGITDETRNLILDYHNSKRNQVALGQESGQPFSSDMILLKWNYTLEQRAQNAANQCTYAHSDSTKRLQNVGQNIAYQVNITDETNFTQYLQDWYNQLYFPGFDPSYINPFLFEAGSTRYSQMLWSQTTSIGCGYAQYLGIDKVSVGRLFFCQYFPAGNDIVGYMYLNSTGEVCTNCTETCSDPYLGLCGTPGQVQLKSILI